MSASRHLHPVQFSDWYHGTTTRQANLSQYSGLSSKSYGLESGYEHPLITRDYGEARRYAKDAAKYSTTGAGAVVHLRIPSKGANNFLVSPGKERSGIKTILPKHMINRVEDV